MKTTWTWKNQRDRFSLSQKEEYSIHEMLLLAFKYISILPYINKKLSKSFWNRSIDYLKDDILVNRRFIRTYCKFVRL